VLAIILDLIFSALQRALVPKGVRLAAAVATGKTVTVGGAA
jgi:osmoprotectant transport system permease protein